MSVATTGSTVKIHYSGTLDDGTPFDSTAGREPLEFTLGTGGIIPGFEAAIMGMAIGETKTVTIPPDQAYGAYDAGMTDEIPRSAVPENIQLQAGMILSAESPDGLPISFMVKSFNEQLVVIDANHPLAGQNLTFALELVEIS
jgi:peptidylprolyl isomerase